MTLQELLNQLKETNRQIERLAPNDPNLFDLKMLALQLEKEMIVGSFNIDKDISAITVADVSKLRELTSQLSQVTNQEQRRSQLVTQIAGIAKLALRSVGLR